MALKSKIGKNFELTPESLEHIKQRHPIMEAHLDNLSGVLRRPDEVRYSIHSHDVLLFYKYFANIEGGKYVVVVVKTNKKNFIITTYLTDKIKSGDKYER